MGKKYFVVDMARRIPLTDQSGSTGPFEEPEALGLQNAYLVKGHGNVYLTEKLTGPEIVNGNGKQ